MDRFRTIDEARAAVAHISFLSRPAAIAKVGVEWKLADQSAEAEFNRAVASIRKILADHAEHARQQARRRELAR